MNNKTKFILVLSAGMVMFLNFYTLAGAAAQQIPPNSHPAADAYDGWRLGVQAWTFNRFTLYEAVDKTASLGLDWIEAYPGQPLSREKPTVNFDDNMSAEIRLQVKDKLNDAGVRLVSYGVVSLPNDEANCRRVFEFAKDMGIEILTAEPPAEALDLIETLCKEYNIKVAIHNHPKPSAYWNPDKILELCKDRSGLIGACADTGHWVRSGLEPVEALKKLDGRIISLHFKDISGTDKDKHDVIWGTGKAKVKEILAELHRQDFKGLFAIEYEYNWENSVPDIRRCVEYFNEAAGALKPTGWRDLLTKDLSDWTYNPGSWTVENGVLTRKGGGDIWTKERFGDFILDMEFKVGKGSNSGVFIRTGTLGKAITAIEVQIHDTSDGSKYGVCGALYGHLPPAKNATKATGQWNHYTITCRANRIYVLLNNEQIIDTDLDLWTEARRNLDGSVPPDWFKVAYKDMPRSGHIGLQDHGDPIWFRNIKIKPLN